MKIGFIVGETEQHELELSFDKASGDLLILMDGTQVLQESARLAVKAVRSYELNIGDLEKHRLALQLTYGDEPVGAGLPAIPRLSLMVSAIAQ